jgi:TonB family protein
MKLLKTLPVLLSSLAILPAQADGVGRMDKSEQKQLTVDFKSCPKPVWPRDALRLEQQGAVKLEFLVGLEGQVLESRVLESSGFPLLDFAAQDGLAKCRFTPPSSVGRSQPVWTRMQYVWKLEDEKSKEERQAEWQRDQLAAQEGNADAQLRLGTAYLSGTPDGTRDAQEGIRWLRAAAEQGHVKAQEVMAFHLQSGLHIARDPEQARSLLEKAVAQGSDSARFALATVLLSQSGMPEKALAKELLQKAAGSGSIEAKGVLALLLLREGGDAVPEGIKLLQEAADNHNRGAQLVLARTYEEGRLVPQDKAKAETLYRRVAAAGGRTGKEAQERLKKLTGTN